MQIATENDVTSCIYVIRLIGCFSTTEKGGAKYEREILMNNFRTHDHDIVCLFLITIIMQVTDICVEF